MICSLKTYFVSSTVVSSKCKVEEQKKIILALENFILVGNKESISVYKFIKVKLIFRVLKEVIFIQFNY